MHCPMASGSLAQILSSVCATVTEGEQNISWIIGGHKIVSDDSLIAKVVSFMNSIFHEE